MTTTRDQKLLLYDEESVLKRFNATYICDPSTGIIRRQRTWGRFPAGSIAGRINPSRGKEYWTICLGSHFYLAHRLIWLYVHGKWPSKNLDHINGDKLDNRIDNLRECTVSQNAMNTAIRITNTSGFKNVHFHKKGGGWFVQVRKGFTRHRVAGFDSAVLADEFASLLRTSLHGEFAHD